MSRPDRVDLKPEFDGYEQRLDKAISHLKNEFMLIRAGRANPQILSKVTVDYYGTPTSLLSIANVSVPEARQLLVSLYDISILKDVEKAILASDIGITPTNDGRAIRLVLPQLTEERRKDLIKQVKKTAEDSKVVLRGERGKMMDLIKKHKKDGAISEDEERQYGVEIQKILDKKVEQIDKVLKEKEVEILEV
ncbi:MAG: ribosome recycling factor [Firmicutes bacterium]|nr:ribosome recycling factor [Bacillota bacterium]